MCQLKIVASSLNHFCQFCCSKVHGDVDPGLRRRLHVLSMKGGHSGYAYDQSHHDLLKYLPLHRQLRLHSECTKAAYSHWSWRKQEEYLDWKAHEKPADVYNAVRSKLSPAAVNNFSGID